jgi:hypothetical protein
MRSLLFFSSFIFIASQACAQHEYLVIGKGGGFSGEVLQYRISPGGKVYKGSGLADTRYALKGKIKKSEARKLFKDMDSIQDSTFHHPGNVYYFIQKIGKDCKTEYTWGENGYEVAEPIKTIYQNAISRLSDVDFKPVKKPVE